MIPAKAHGTVRNSALGWLRRLGWRHLAATEHHALLQDSTSGMLLARVRQRLQASHIHAHGQTWPLDAGGIAQVLAVLSQLSLRRGAETGNDALLQLLRNGIAVTQWQPDGSALHGSVQLIDWDCMDANRWELADTSHIGQSAQDGHARIGALTGYVNGLPLLRLLCVERDALGCWGQDTAAIGLQLQRTRAHAPDAAEACVQLLLALDRRGGRYASGATPAEAWLRWREHGWTRQSLQQLRDTAPRHKYDTTVDDRPSLRHVHAPLLAGLIAPTRLLALLRSFIAMGADGRRRIARPAQFFAVQASLHQLRQIDADGRRCGGQVCLAAGSGASQARQWLLQGLRRDPWLRHCRVLWLRAPPSSQQGSGALACTDTLDAMPPAARSPGRRVAAFMAEGRGSTLQIAPGTLKAWLRRRDARHEHDDLIVLVDGPLQEGDADQRWLQRAAGRLPRAAWLWWLAAPSTDLHVQEPAPPLYAYPMADAVADGVVVPVVHQRSAPRGRSGSADAAPGAHIVRRAATIGQHFRDHVQLTERDLQGLLLVDDAAAARRYHRAFARDGGLRSMVLAGNAQARAGHTPVDLLIVTAGTVLPQLHQRMALLYLDTALPTHAWPALLGLLNRVSADKPGAWLLDLHDPPGWPGEAIAMGWGPQPLQQADAALPLQHRRLQALLPAASCTDFHAGRAHLGPYWTLDAQGRDRDLHAPRRRILHRRVTAFGQLLQAAQAALPSQAGAGADRQRGWQYLHDLHFCSLLRDAVNTDAQDTHQYQLADVRVRHWARACVGQVHETVEDYAALRSLDTPDPRAQADLLHSQLRQRWPQDRADPQPRAWLQRQLRALLSSTPASVRLDRLRALRAQLATAADSTLPPTAGPLQRACHALLLAQLGERPALPPSLATPALAETLASALSAVRLSAGPPHQCAADLRRRLRPALSALLDSDQQELLLATLLELPVDTAPDGTA